MPLTTVIAILAVFGLTTGENGDCISRKKVSTVVESVLHKRKGMDIKLTPDDLENLVSLRYGCAQVKPTTRQDIFFSAHLTNLITSSSSNQVIKFNKVETNEGNAYNPSTGTFTCPKNGTYWFSFGILSCRPGRIDVNLYINGHSRLRSLTPEGHKYTTAERSYFFSLRKGDVVQVRVYDGGACIHSGSFTTFSGMYISDK